MQKWKEGAGVVEQQQMKKRPPPGSWRNAMGIHGRPAQDIGEGDGGGEGEDKGDAGDNNRVSIASWVLNRGL